MSSSSTDTAAEARGQRALVTVTMPDPGPEEGEATVVSWCVTVGDEVGEGDPICVVSVGGHHAEVLSASAGRVAALLAGLDARVPAGGSLAELAALAPVRREPEWPAPDPEVAVDIGSFHSPAVRRLAMEHGIDLGVVEGTGRGGRIRMEDVLARVTATPERTSNIRLPGLKRRSAGIQSL
jgi:2-oxoisovalerate dehydrogenase E2 component (dihydrolipoyl transacylase)